MPLPRSVGNPSNTIWSARRSILPYQVASSSIQPFGHNSVGCHSLRRNISTNGYQSTRHRVISSHGHVVTRSTRHTHVSSHSQLVTSQHITKPPVPVIIISARRQETSRNSAQHGWHNYRYLCYFNVYCRIQITATDYTSTKSTINSVK